MIALAIREMLLAIIILVLVIFAWVFYYLPTYYPYGGNDHLCGTSEFMLNISTKKTHQAYVYVNCFCWH